MDWVRKYSDELDFVYIQALVDFCNMEITSTRQVENHFSKLLASSEGKFQKIPDDGVEAYKADQASARELLDHLIKNGALDPKTEKQFNNWFKDKLQLGEIALVLQEGVFILKFMPVINGVELAYGFTIALLSSGHYGRTPLIVYVSKCEWKKCNKYIFNPKQRSKKYCSQQHAWSAQKQRHLNRG